MRKIPYYEIGIAIDKAIGKTSLQLEAACLYRSYAGAILANLYSPVVYGVNVGVLFIYRGDRVIKLGPEDNYDIDQEPGRAFVNGDFHAWIVRPDPTTLIDLSARHFRHYDQEGIFGSLAHVPAVLKSEDAVVTFGEIELRYRASIPAARLAYDHHLSGGVEPKLHSILVAAQKILGAPKANFKRKGG